ncbi:hypothetical protein GIB67_027186 [Kingdonia uniflora]|uniref:Protein kinase domain-containing protein n=1 Tax=Kingdonia uniflora TaxID=39325 RepID=A0A7J7LT01_9MAGN|nr:hypothetical protein GIB67_027186 [Kingdonia uniflora]
MRLSWEEMVGMLMQLCILVFMVACPAGRSGRREKPSLAVYVAFDGPLDQNFMKFPQKLFGRPIECYHIDAQNKQVYEGAVYMHQGKTYLVNALDLSGKVALCQEADLKYYTKTLDYTDIHVIGGDIAYPANVGETQHSRTTAQAHTCTVTTTWFGFFRIWQGSNEIFDTVDLSLPNYSYESQMNQGLPFGDDNFLFIVVPNLYSQEDKARGAQARGPLPFVRHFSNAEIKKAAGGFSSIIATHYDGSAYKAQFRGGLVVVVKEVKIFNEARDAFNKEVQLLMRLHHQLL